MLLPSAGRRNACPKCKAAIGVQPSDIHGYCACPKCATRIWASVVDSDARYYLTSPIETALLRPVRAELPPYDFDERLTVQELRDRIAEGRLAVDSDVVRVWEEYGVRDSREAAYVLVREGLLSPWSLKQLYLGCINEFFASEFIIRDILGVGHTCDVALATRHGEVFALKIAGPTRGITYLENECATVRAADSPHLVQCVETTVIRHAKVGEQPCLVREYLPGLTLRRLVDAVGPLPPDLNAHLFIGVARALQALHERGIVHQRVNPRKIFVTERGEGKLIGSGLMRNEQDKTNTYDDPSLMGSRYLPTEQAIIHGVGTSESDIYSLGLSLRSAMVWPEDEPATASQPGAFAWIGEFAMQAIADEMAFFRPEARPKAEAVIKRLQCWLESH